MYEQIPTWHGGWYNNGKHITSTNNDFPYCCLEFQEKLKQIVAGLFEK